MSRTGWAAIAATGIAGFLAGRATGPFDLMPNGGTQPPLAADALENELARAIRQPETFPRAAAMVALLKRLTPENAAGAVRAIAGAAGEDDPLDLQLVLSAWVRVDPLAAIREVESWPLQSRRELGLRIVMREWATSGSPLEAAAYVDSLTDPTEREIAAAPLVRGWAASGDEAQALEVARQFFNREGRRDVVDAWVRGVLRARGADRVLALARSLDPKSADPFDRNALRVVLDLAARENPRGAAAFYDELTAKAAAPRWLEGSLVRLARLMRNGDPKATLEWLLARPDDLERTLALRETMGSWAKRDLDSAWKWFEDYRSASARTNTAGTISPTESTLLAGLVRRMARVRPSEASRWAIQLIPGPERIEMLRRVAYFWSESDPVAADRWIASLDLSPRDREQVEQGAAWGRRKPETAEIDPHDGSDQLDRADAAAEAARPFRAE